MFKKYKYKWILSRVTGCWITGCIAPCLFLRYPDYIVDCIGFDSLVETSVDQKPFEN